MGLNSQWFQVASVAAQFSQCQIRNPVGSGVVVVVDRVMVSQGVADTPAVTLERTKTTDFSSLSTVTISLDARASGSPVVMSAGSNAAIQHGAATNQIALVTTFANSAPIEMLGGHEVPVLPGDALMAYSNTVNTPIIFSYLWRTRPLESSELT